MTARSNARALVGAAPLGRGVAIALVAFLSLVTPFARVGAQTPGTTTEVVPARPTPTPAPTPAPTPTPAPAPTPATTPAPTPAPTPRPASADPEVDAGRRRQRTDERASARDAGVDAAFDDAGDALDAAVEVELELDEAGVPIAAPVIVPCDAGPDAEPCYADAAVEIDAAMPEVDAAVVLPPPIDSIVFPPEPPAPTPPPAPISAETFAIRTIVGLLVLLALAWLFSRPQFVQLERRLGISGVMASGLPFVLFGLISHDESVGILTGRTLAELQPILHLGLGWIGFYTGYQFDLRGLDALPKGTAGAVSAVTAGAFFVVAGWCGSALLLEQGAMSFAAWQDIAFLIAALILGAAAAMSGPTASSRRRPANTPRVPVDLLDDIAAVACLALLGAYFRPRAEQASWNIPGTAWLFVTLGLGAALGILVYVVMRRKASEVESTTLTLGSVAFAAGLAAYLHLPALVVCFIVGALVGNLPGEYRSSLHDVLARLERPIHLVFLVIAGALWRDAVDWHGWILVPFFVVGRIAGRWFGQRAAARLDKDAGIVAAALPIVAPMSPLAVALVVSYDVVFRFQGEAVPRLMTAVIGSSIITEIIVQSQLPGRSRSERPPPRDDAATHHEASVRDVPPADATLHEASASDQTVHEGTTASTTDGTSSSDGTTSTSGAPRREDEPS